MWIRGFKAADAAGCADVFYRGVHEGAVERYDAAQRSAWAPNVPDAEAFARRLGAQVCYVADAGAVEGFMSLREDGYLDMAYVAPARRGTGLAAQLYAAILNAAHAAGHAVLTSDASLLARPFFERQGWEVVRAEEVERAGVSIPRYHMTIHLCE